MKHLLSKTVYILLVLVCISTKLAYAGSLQEHDNEVVFVTSDVRLTGFTITDYHITDKQKLEQNAIVDTSNPEDTKVTIKAGRKGDISNTIWIRDTNQYARPVAYESNTNFAVIATINLSYKNVDYKCDNIALEQVHIGSHHDWFFHQNLNTKDFVDSILQKRVLGIDCVSNDAIALPKQFMVFPHKELDEDSPNQFAFAWSN